MGRPRLSFLPPFFHGRGFSVLARRKFEKKGVSRLRLSADAIPSWSAAHILRYLHSALIHGTLSGTAVIRVHGFSR